MEEIAAAIGVAQPALAGADIEDQRALRLGQIGDGEHAFGGRVDENHGRCRERGPGSRGEVASRRDGNHFQPIMVAEEAAGRLGIGECELGPGDTEMLDLFRMARRGIALVPSGRMSAIYVDELARLLVTLAADRDASIGQIYEPDDGKPTGWSHRGFARAVARAVGRQRLSTVATPALLLKAGGRLDQFVRRSRAKLTPDRARYIAHPDWVATEGKCPPAALWRPERDTDDALAETVRWYRREGWL